MRQGMVCASLCLGAFGNDAQFEKKVRDVVGLYLNPPERALVLCVDEKSILTKSLLAAGLK